jgi:hypothetical protein
MEKMFLLSNCPIGTAKYLMLSGGVVRNQKGKE